MFIYHNSKNDFSEFDFEKSGYGSGHSNSALGLWGFIDVVQKDGDYDNFGLNVYEIEFKDEKIFDLTTKELWKLSCESDKMDNPVLFFQNMRKELSKKYDAIAIVEESNHFMERYGTLKTMYVVLKPESIISFKKINSKENKL